jgi:hypothetical protein
MYESDLTKFMRDLFRQKPHLAEAQQEARSIWWDKKVDFEELRRMRESRVPVRGYVYYPLLQPLGTRRSTEPAAGSVAES